MASGIFKVTFDDGFNCDSCASGAGRLCKCSHLSSMEWILTIQSWIVDVDVIGAVVGEDVTWEVGWNYSTIVSIHRLQCTYALLALYQSSAVVYSWECARHGGKLNEIIRPCQLMQCACETDMFWSPLFTLAHCVYYILCEGQNQRLAFCTAFIFGFAITVYECLSAKKHIQELV